MRSRLTRIATGQEWLVDASGCSPAALRDVPRWQALFAEMISSLRLTQVGQAQWHQFPGSMGLTGLALLSESHLAVHTFPEHGYAALSLYSCRLQAAPDFERMLKAGVQATHVCVRQVPREAMAFSLRAVP